jgi:hypothetical protein
VRFRHTIAAAVTGFAMSVPALAGDGRPHDPLSRVEPQALFQGVVRESDVALVFDYLRSALAAAAAGREAPAPDALRKRAETLAAELRMRGALAGLLLLSVLEAEAGALLRELTPPARPELPPVTPFTRTATD